MNQQEIRLAFADLSLARKKHVLSRTRGLAQFITKSGVVDIEKVFAECDRRPAMYAELQREIRHVTGKS